MDSAAVSLALGFLTATMVAAIVMRLLENFAPGCRAGHGAAGLAAGYVAGYVLLAPEAVFRPTSYWHYLPYVVIVASFAGGVLAAGFSQYRLLRVLITAAVVGGAAWVLFPTWPDLRPIAMPTIACLAAFLWMLTLATEPLAQRTTSRQWLAIILLVSAVQAATIAACVSLRLGQLSLLTAGALLGCLVAIRRGDERAHWGMTTGWVVSSGGGAFIGAIDPEPPLWPLMLFAAAPLSLWVARMVTPQSASARAAFTWRFASIAFVIGAIAAWSLAV